MTDLRAQARQLKADGQAEQAVALVKQSYNPAVSAYLQTLRDFVQMQQQSAQTNLAQMSASRMLTVKIAAVAVGALLLAIIGGAYFLIRSIQQPLAQANDLASRIAAGDLSMQATITRGDEFGDLLRSQYAMSDALGRVVHQVRQSTDSIATASAEIATGNHDLSARTEQTSSNLQETAAAMEQFTSTIQQSASSAQQASSLAVGATGVARRGGEVVTQVRLHAVVVEQRVIDVEQKHEVMHGGPTALPGRPHHPKPAIRRQCQSAHDTPRAGGPRPSAWSPRLRRAAPPVPARAAIPAR
jgi:methyl-accepting chemotaxis protein